MSINGIVICDDKYGVAREGTIPFSNKLDLKLFQKLTLDQIVLISRTTLDRIPNKLPGRKKLVISRDRSYVCPYSNTVTFYSVDEAVDYYVRRLEFTDTHRDLFVAGGPAIYNLMSSYYTTFYVTRVVGDFGCDEFFNHRLLDDAANVVKSEVVTCPVTSISMQMIRYDL